MAIFRIESVPIRVMRMGWFGGDHLQIVLQQDELTTVQDSWYVLEGTKGEKVGFDVRRLGVLGWDGETTLSEANGDVFGLALEAVIGTPYWRGSSIIDLGAAEFEKWRFMARVASDFEAQQYPYVAFADIFDAKSTINSSSIIASLMYYIGLDIADNLPDALRISPGRETLLGTADHDNLKVQWGFKNLYGGEGNDVLTGSAGNILPEKLYGGKDDDIIFATTGVDYYNGGEYGLDYNKDGVDTIIYSDVTLVTLTLNDEAAEHYAPDIHVLSTGGYDELYSIERIEWDELSTKVIFGPGILFLRDSMRLKLGDQSSLDQGDHLDFSTTDTALVINTDVDGHAVVQAASAKGTNIGLWLESVEWLTGSPLDDKIYTTASLFGVEGDRGNDLIDVRLSTPFAGLSPRDYDIEIDGGEGDDTIVAGTGRTIAKGGGGADRFVLSGVTQQGSQMAEFVIEDAAREDRAFIPIDLFNLTYADFEGSPLFPLLGALGRHPGEDSFAELPQNLGPYFGGPANRSDFLEFEWRTQNTRNYGNDDIHGVIEFTGAIFYNRDGADLLIHVFLGDPMEVTEEGNDDRPWTHTVNVFYSESETIIRVKDFQDGKLGIFFHDPGEPDVIALDTDHGHYAGYDYPGWDAAVLATTNGGQMTAALDERPTAPVYELNEQSPGTAPPLLIGSGGNDTITATTGAARLEGGAGNDTLTGSAGNDTLDGGTGDDQMTGGAGNDVYIVDSAADVVIELAGGGTDRVIASANFTLAVNVEDLELSGLAVAGTGNSGTNRLFGNESANTLSGLGGADFLYGLGGDDILIGGAGDDRYVYASGGGDDIIRDYGAEADADVLILEGYRPEEVTLFRLISSPGDLIFALADGSRIRIENYAGADGAGIEGVRFTGGIQWSKFEFDAFAAAASVIGNGTPVARDDVGFMAASGNVDIPVADLLANDRDGDGDTLSIVAISDVSAGASVTLLANGGLTLSTPEGAAGEVTFRYSISDGHGGTSSAMVAVGLIPNYAPVAAGNLAPQSAVAGAPWNYALASGVFTDADQDPLQYSASLAGGAPLPAWLMFNSATRTFSGTPPAGFTGVLSLLITASDGLAQTAAPLQLTISSGNAAPVAVADTGFATQQYVPVVIAAAALLANDSDGDGDTLSLVSVQGAVHGSVSRNAAGNIVFTPDAGYTGAASFAYTVSDGRGGTASATVSVTVTAPPVGLVITGTNGSETLTGGLGSDTIEGRAGDDTLIGGYGDDVFLIAGNDGLDTFDGGLGFDTIRGGAGNDTIGLATGQASLAGIEAISGGAGFDVLRLSAGDDVLDLSAIAVTGLEEIRGAAGNDTITGSAGNDSINGGGGNDVLSGGAGDDAFLVTGNGGFDDFNGGAGFDRVLGSAGDDTIGLAHGTSSLVALEAIDGGAGFDVLRLSTGADVLDLTAITVTGIEEIRGGAGNDTITGSAGDDTINGGGGMDTLDGGAGNDTFLVAGNNGYDGIRGGAGYDRILGSAGDDIIRFANTAGNLAGIEAIDAGGGTDQIVLTAGDDTLDLSGLVVTGIAQINAGAGNDRIVASASNDTLRGGAGADLFVFRHGFGHDTIADFQRGTVANPLVDVIDFSDFTFANFAAVTSHAVQDGADTLITLDASTSLRLSNISLASLHADDFRVI